jgi:ABC-2 type transport system permease protein
MKNLLHKEFTLWWHPAWFLFLLFGSLLLIPSWPFFIAFGYIFIAISNVFITGRANQDIFFTVMLPVRKRDIVLARIYSIAIIEILQIIVAIPFAIINNSVYLTGNMMGMNTNFAFFGFIFIMYAIFNIVFLPQFYKTAYKVMPMLFAIFIVTIFVAAINAAVMLIPVLRINLNGLGATHLASQLPILFVGIILFLSTTMLTYRISANRFERIDM